MKKLYFSSCWTLMLVCLPFLPSANALGGSGGSMTLDEFEAWTLKLEQFADQALEHRGTAYDNAAVRDHCTLLTTEAYPGDIPEAGPIRERVIGAAKAIGLRASLEYSALVGVLRTVAADREADEAILVKILRYLSALDLGIEERTRVVKESLALLRGKPEEGTVSLLLVMSTSESVPHSLRSLFLGKAMEFADQFVEYRDVFRSSEVRVRLARVAAGKGLRVSATFSRWDAEDRASRERIASQLNDISNLERSVNELERIAASSSPALDGGAFRQLLEDILSSNAQGEKADGNRTDATQALRGMFDRFPSQRPKIALALYDLSGGLQGELGSRIKKGLLEQLSTLSGAGMEENREVLKECLGAIGIVFETREDYLSLMRFYDRIREDSQIKSKMMQVRVVVLEALARAYQEHPDAYVASSPEAGTLFHEVSRRIAEYQRYLIGPGRTQAGATKAAKTLVALEKSMVPPAVVKGKGRQEQPKGQQGGGGCAGIFK